MKKTLAALTAAYMLSGCASEESLSTAQRYERENAIADHRIDCLNQSRAPHSIDNVILAGTEYAVERVKIRQEGELDFALREYNGSTVFQDDEKREITIESDKVYIPTRHMVSTAGTTKPASEVYFNTTGSYAVKARIGETAKSEGIALRSRTEQDTQFELRTISINGRFFYIPVTLDASGNITGTYLVPVEGTHRGINQLDGRIILRNPGNIYKLTAVAQTAYNSRTPLVIATETTATPAADIR